VNQQSPVISKRAGAVAPFRVMRVLEGARELESQGTRVIHMEIGEPDFPTPDPILKAGQRALAEGRTHYTPARGLADLRGAIADYYRKRYRLDIDSDRVLITPGASGALQLLLAGLLDPGDGVLLADPGYPCNRNLVQMLGGIPVSVPVGPETGYQITAALLDAVWRPGIRLVMVASPSNPTGTVLGASELRALYLAVRERGASLLVDEIYQGLLFEGEDHTALACGQDGVFVVNSFSKFFGMTGWRLGWIVAPSDCIDVLDRLAQNLYLAAPTPSQYAALWAFRPETLAILEQRRKEFERRRDFLLPALTRIGFSIPTKPAGAFYLYAQCSEITDDSERLASQLLETSAVAVTPGTDFGDHQPLGHLRFAYTTSIENLNEGVVRIERYLG